MIEKDEVQFLGARAWVTEGFGEVVKRAGRCYTDGAGWSKHTPKDLGKVASGGAAFEYNVNEHGPSVINVEGFYAEVPGKQSVPRAEAWSVAMALHHVPRSAPVCIGVDALYVHQGVLQRRRPACGDNGDIWSVVFDRIDERDGITRTVKIKSHLEDNGAQAIAQSGIDWDHIVGNALADEAANVGEEELRPHDDLCEQARLNESTVYRVVMPPAVIQADIWRHRGAEGFEQPEEVPRCEPAVADQAEELRLALVKNGHRLTRWNQWHICEGCKKWRCANNRLLV